MNKKTHFITISAKLTDSELQNTLSTLRNMSDINFASETFYHLDMDDILAWLENQEEFYNDTNNSLTEKELKLLAKKCMAYMKEQFYLDDYQREMDFHMKDILRKELDEDKWDILGL